VMMSFRTGNWRVSIAVRLRWSGRDFPASCDRWWMRWVMGSM
jgi:hypothetical protein